jgi:hypothetical protein
VKRVPGVTGLTYEEANPGGRVTRSTISTEVLDARRRIERDYPNVRCYSDLETKEHLITQRDATGTETLVFATPFARGFHEELIRARLERARNDKSDPFEEIEAWNARVEAEQDRRFTERIHEVGEKLAFAFGQDGLTVRPRMVPRSIKLRKINKLQNYQI